MPTEEEILDQGEDLDFDPELDQLFYTAGQDDCLFEESEYRSMLSQVGDQDMWSDHSSNECIMSFCGGLTRVWKEAMGEINDLKRNICHVLHKNSIDEVSRDDIVELFYGRHSRLYRVFHDHLGWSHSKFLMFIRTCGKLLEFNFTTTQAYDFDGMMDGMMWQRKIL